MPASLAFQVRRPDPASRAVWRLLIGMVLCGAVGCAARGRYVDPDHLPDDWRTQAERSNYEETGTAEQALEFCRRLAAASPYVRYATFGTSAEGRELPLLVLSTERAFTPAAARRSERPLILIQNCIHAGECEGKDACLALLRDMVVTGTQAALLERINLLVIPIFNIDGHERRSPYSRINQNGPRLVGWRTTATNLNLNRDYTKADSREMQAWLRLWNDWQPDLFLDTHTTDGEVHRYDLFYSATEGPETPAPVAEWMRTHLLPPVLARLTGDGYHLLPYGGLRNRRAPQEGFVGAWAMLPRFSTGYAAACNRAAVLIEAYARHPYARRVRATYDFLRHTLAAVNQRADELRALSRAADAGCAAARGAGSDGRVPLAFEHTQESRPIIYRGYRQGLRNSEITGDAVIEYTSEPVDLEIPLFDRIRVTASVSPPLAYLVPPQWEDVLARLEWHGVRFSRLREACTVLVESFRFRDVTFAERPQEGRQLARYTCVPVTEARTFAPGTALIPTDQPRARLLVQLLEPDGPDSFVAWGFFNTIFEPKEYAEAYVMEPLAREMLAGDPALRAEFEERLARDAEFARSAGQRLDFFYRRSKYADERQNVYPVARITDASVLARLR